MILVRDVVLCSGQTVALLRSSLNSYMHTVHSYLAKGYDQGVYKRLHHFLPAPRFILFGAALMAVLLRLFGPRLSLRRSSPDGATKNGQDEEDSLVNTATSLPPPASMSTEPCNGPAFGRMRVVLTLLSACLCLMFIFFLPVKDVLRQVVELQRGHPATYMITYIIAGLVVPAPLLSVLAGVLMGPSILAVIVIMCGSLGAACLAFFVSRFLLRQLVVKKFVLRSKQLQAIDAALRTDSLKLVLCTRMVLPFTFNNYFLGTTSVTATTFALATTVTGIPFAIIYTIVGGELQSLDTALTAESFELRSTDISVFGYYTISKKYLEITGICACVCFFFFVVRTVKQFADRVIQEAQEPQRQLALQQCARVVTAFHSL